MATDLKTNFLLCLTVLSLLLPVAPAALHGAELKPIATVDQFDDWVTALEWSPDGKTLACGSYETIVFWRVPAEKAAVEAGEPETGQPVPAAKKAEPGSDSPAPWKKLPGTIRTLLFRADGTELVVGGYQRIQRRAFPSGKVLGEFRSHRGTVTGLIAVTDKRFLSAADDGTLNLSDWDGKIFEHWENEEPITAIGFDPVRKLIAVALGDETRVTRPGELVLIDLESWKETGRLELHRSATTDLLFSLDRQTILTASFDETVIVTRIDQQTPAGIFREHGRPVNCLAAIPGTELIISGSGGRYKKKNELKIWKQGTGGIVWTGEPHAERISCLAVSPDGTRLATGGYDNSVRVWDIREFRK